MCRYLFSIGGGMQTKRADRGSGGLHSTAFQSVWATLDMAGESRHGVRCDPPNETGKEIDERPRRTIITLFSQTLRRGDKNRTHRAALFGWAGFYT